MRCQASTRLIGLSLVLAMATGVAVAYDRHLLVVNRSSSTIEEFYGSNTGTEDWEEDILGENVLEPGDQADINFDDDTGYCKFDFLVVFDDGTRSTEEDFNVCDYGTLTITD